MKEIYTRKLIKHFRKSRSQKALQVLVMNHQAAIRLAASYSMDYPFDLPDKIQMGNEVLLKSVEKEFDLRFKQRFVTYLIPKIKNYIIDEVRRYHKIHKGELIKQVQLAEHYAAEEPTEFIELNEEKERLITEIQKLTYNQQIVMGCLLQGMKMKEIADQSGVTVSRISQIAGKAKINLRKALAD